MEKICNRIKYVASEKGGITDSINCNFAIIRIDSYNSLILIKSVVNENKNKYYHNIFLGKGLCKDTIFLYKCLYIINAIFR